MNVTAFLNKHNISEMDLLHIKTQGKSLEDLIKNYDLIRAALDKGKNYVNLKTPLVAKDVVYLTPNELPEYVHHYDTVLTTTRPSQFVPASGYASRMFGYIENYLNATSISEYNHTRIMATIRGLNRNTSGPKFAFANQLYDSFRSKDTNLDLLITESLAGNKESTARILREILYKDGLNFKSFPKALLPFHRNGTEPVIALSEHIEFAKYSGKSKLSIAVSPFHEQMFHAALDRIVTNHPDYADLPIDISFQQPETDSIAINPDTGEIIRDHTGTILFFPAGHGSLLTNIHETCFIRNVDNIPFGEERRKVLSNYHKAMVGKLASLKRIIGTILTTIDNGSIVPEALNDYYHTLSDMKLHLFMNSEKYNNADFRTQKAILREALDRPICIFGLVHNSGEPGGGPFFYSIDGIVTSSIVERDEISPEQSELMAHGEFFNPVEILFDPTDHQGRLFDDLTQFEDRNRHILVRKLFDGKPTVRIEYPGLWNGRMAKCNKLWITIPSNIFAPVKELLDLLGEKHLAAPY